MQHDAIAYCYATPVPGIFSESTPENLNIVSSPVSDRNIRTLPEEFLLLKYGRNSYTKNAEENEFFFSQEDADVIIKEFNSRNRDLVIDFEHQSVSGEKAPAAGWISELRKSPEGLTAIVKYWTKEAEELILSGKYRYFSPVLYFSGETGSVISIHSVALTNHPALHNIPALAADDLSGIIPSPEEKEKELFFKTHKLKNFADAEKRLYQAEKILRKEKLRLAFSQGILTENMRTWAERLLQESPDLFDLWCQTAPRLVPDNLFTDQAPVCEKKYQDSPLEKEIFSMLGLTETTQQE